MCSNIAEKYGKHFTKRQLLHFRNDSINAHSSSIQFQGLEHSEKPIECDQVRVHVSFHLGEVNNHHHRDTDPTDMCEELSVGADAVVVINARKFLFCRHMALLHACSSVLNLTFASIRLSLSLFLRPYHSYVSLWQVSFPA